MKPVGWRGESTRHSLASRGIPTSLQDMGKNERSVYYVGSADAVDAFYLGGSKNVIEHERDEMIMTLRRKGLDENRIINRVNRWIMKMYRGHMRSMDDRLDYMEEHIEDRFGDEGIKDIPRNYQIYMKGYKAGMKERYESMMIKG